MDLDTVTAALDRLYAKAPHLHRPDDITATILGAYQHRSPAADSPYPMGRVVHALWPVGAAAGARRGHAITVGAIRGEVAQALADPYPDPRGQWVVLGMVKAADDLPPVPQPRPYGLRESGLVVTDPGTLDQALAVGLFSSWRAGHADGAERAFSLFVDAVVDMIGHERLATTFLTAELTALSLLDEIGYRSYRVAEHDQEHPSPAPATSDPTTTRRARPAGSRSFVALRRLDPDRRLPTRQPGRIGNRTGRTGPGR